MDAMSSTPQRSTIPALLLHAGYMSGAEYPHMPFERERLMREQHERDEQAREFLLTDALFTLGLR
jgi:hypothetical protein